MLTNTWNYDKVNKLSARQKFIKKEFQKNEIHSWQKTEDMIKYPSRQQNDNKILTQKCLKKLEKSTWQTKRDEIK